jgi:hypothetical protein
MISIVDAGELRNVLRPTVYRPNPDEFRRGDAPPAQDRSSVKGDSAVREAVEARAAR